MDVNQHAVENVLHKFDVNQLIHGHTHRPATHQLLVNGKAATRIVLSDWGTQGHFLRCNETGCKEITFN